MKKYPNEEDNFANKQKNKRVNNSILKTLKNPDVCHINLDSHFIYDEEAAINYFNKINNKNLIKPTKEEITLLKKISNEINTKQILSNNKEALIDINIEYAEKIFSFQPKIENNKDEIIDFIKESIENSKDRGSISCRKLSQLYEKKFNKKIGKSTIHKILRNRLNLRYLKTVYKTRRLEYNNNKVYCFFFIKALIKCIKLGFNFIFFDESKLELKNNHFRAWRRKEEQILFGIKNNIKTNLILAVGPEEVFYYRILDDNTNSNIILDVLEKIKIKIREKNEKKYVLILDNCSSHKSEEVIKYLNNNKINTIFTPPYQSTFTPIELAFRAIKKINYLKIYNDVKELLNDVELFLNDEKTKKTLLYNYKETINQYISYIDLNNNINLNNLII